MPNAQGILYVVATPIGNLEDITLRALRILREVAVIAAEDTRVTRKLLAHYDLHTPLTSYHAHTGTRKIEELVERMVRGESIALVSDAGTPGISDPGGSLVRAALERGVPVVPVPGSSALLAALSASGLDTSGIVFNGFLPRKAGDRKKTLEPLRALPHTLVFYESPSRVGGTLEVLASVLGDRTAVVARELTKKFEEHLRGTLSELAARCAGTLLRGECVILVSGASPAGAPGERPATGEPPATETSDDHLRTLLAQGVSVRDAARTVAEATGQPRKHLYARALELAPES